MFLHVDNLMNRNQIIEVTKHQIRRNEFRMRKSEQEALQNGKQIEMEVSFYTDSLVNFV